MHSVAFWSSLLYASSPAQGEKISFISKARTLMDVAVGARRPMETCPLVSCLVDASVEVL